MEEGISRGRDNTTKVICYEVETKRKRRKATASLSSTAVAADDDTYGDNHTDFLNDLFYFLLRQHRAYQILFIIL